MNFYFLISHMELLQKRAMSLMGLAPHWLYKLTANGRKYFECLEKVQRFSLKVLRERKAIRDTSKTNHQNYFTISNSKCKLMNIKSNFKEIIFL